MQSQEVMVVMNQCCTASTLKVSIVVFGFLGMLMWGSSIGFVIGYDDVCFGLLVIALSLLIPINVGYIYVTSRIMFLISHISFPSETSLLDLNKNTARLLAFMVAGFSLWVTSTVWFAVRLDYYDCYMIFFLCNFGFVPAAVVVGMAGGLGDMCSRKLFGGRVVPSSVGQAPSHRYAPPPPRRPSSVSHMPSFNRVF
ncbi:uncharacterized protein [Panulirus ornatus]|uniref:uncharacterized protein n=1 Tax=Panulirus ornatus TaxID=150431 RepID=UPI003A868E37